MNIERLDFELKVQRLILPPHPVISTSATVLVAPELR